MRRLAFVLILLVTAAPAFAGVVFEVEVKTHGSSPPRVESSELAAQGSSLKMEISSGDKKASRNTVVFRGDRREMVVVDHKERSYFVMDEETMKRLAGQVNQAMAQMEEALKQLPESQRAQVEKMMKQRMPAAAQAEGPKTELRETGERGTQAGYPCVKYEILRGGTKLRELWVTDWGNVEGGAEAMKAFEGMADFFRQMMGSMGDLGRLGSAAFEEAGFEHMRDLGGFPVVTRELAADGSLQAESTLRSSQRRDLDPAVFEPPAGYKQRKMF